MSNCQLCLDNYEGRYHPGNTIQGRVICVFNSPKNVREIRLKVRGEEHNQWTKTESTTDSDGKSIDRQVTYSGYNRFYGIEIVLERAGEISAGRHEYQFSINLPRDLPGSYKGSYGYIRYTIKACVDRPLKFDYKIAKEITVMAPVDLNMMKHQIHLNPVVYSEDQTSCCCCFFPQPITMNVYMQKGWFTAGETALVRVNLTNLSNESVEEVYAKIKMDIVSRVTSPRSDSKTSTVVIATDRQSGVGAHGERSYNLQLRIPQATQIPNFVLCKLFEKRAQLKVTAVIPGCSGDMKIRAKIDLGHIPIDEPHLPMRFQSDSLASSRNNQYPGIHGGNFGPQSPGPSAPPMADAPAPTHAQYSESLPPSYEDAIASPPKYR